MRTGLFLVAGLLLLAAALLLGKLFSALIRRLKHWPGSRARLWLLFPAHCSRLLSWQP